METLEKTVRKSLLSPEPESDFGNYVQPSLPSLAMTYRTSVQSHNFLLSLMACLAHVSLGIVEENLVCLVS